MKQNHDKRSSASTVNCLDYCNNCKHPIWRHEDESGECMELNCNCEKYSTE